LANRRHSSQGFWQVTSASYSLNGNTVQRAGNTAILDTGTTLALIDDTILSQIYGAIEGATFDQAQGGWKYPENATVPTVEFAIGETLYTVNQQDFAFGPADTGFIFGGIQSRGDLTFDILGNVLYLMELQKNLRSVKGTCF
jgi:Eukaryotic aspartyl protease